MERVTADKFFMNLERALMAQADAAGVLSSSTGKGSAREQLLGDTLDSCLPNRLQVERGEVVDGNGLTTGETDLVLVDSNRGSRVIGGESVIPVEAAIAVVEVKSSLRGGELESAVKKIARVKALTRGPHTGIYNFSDATEPKIAVPPTRTLGVIFGYTAPKGTTILRRLGDNPSWYDRDFMEFGPDVIAVPEQGVLMKNDLHIFAPPPGAENLTMLGDADLPAIQVIVQYAEVLLDRYGDLTYPRY